MKENRFYIITLFDYYGCLLTKKQQLYFCEYFFNDRSLSELSNEYLSHSAIQNVLKTIKNELIKYKKLSSCFGHSIKHQKLYSLINDKDLKNKLLSLEFKGTQHKK